MTWIIVEAASIAFLAWGCYAAGLGKGRAEGSAMRRALEREIRGLRLGGALRDPFKPTPDRLTGDRSARKVYK
jgi:hypothetical protein